MWPISSTTSNWGERFRRAYASYFNLPFCLCVSVCSKLDGTHAIAVATVAIFKTIITKSEWESAE